MYKLIIEDDEGKTTVVPLIRDEITIGRKEGNTIRLTERNVSRRHARFLKVNGAVYLEDLQSHTGIKVNGDRIAGRVPVAEGDRIQIGDYRLALQVERQATAGERRGDEHTTPFSRADEETASRAAAAMAPTRLQPQLEVKLVEQPARVVVVSANFAGREFVLDKPVTVLGRTEDNDVVLDHRSISRHHAKIVHEGGHYHIMDLQSANGVRVNGEDYGKVELRKGDYIDLGHVRLRFVAPGEDFAFARDAQVIDTQRGSGRRTLLIASGIIVVAALALGGLVVGKLLGGDRGGQVHSVGPDVETQVAKLTVECDRALLGFDWDTAIARAEAGLLLDPQNELLREKKARAEIERKNRERFEKFQRAANDGALDDAVNLYQQLSDNSVYHQKGEELYGTTKRAYIKQHLEAARALPPTQCEEIRRHADLVLIIDESNAAALEIAKRCGAPPTPRKPSTTASKSGTDRVETPPTGRDPKEPSSAAAAVKEPAVERPSSRGAGEGDDDVEQLLAEAQNDYIHGNHAAAREKARRANKGGNNLKAWRIIGTTSCFLQDRQGAVMAWNRLDQSNRNLLKYVCSRSSIEIP